MAIKWLACFAAFGYQPTCAQGCPETSGEIIVNQTFGTAANRVSVEGLTPYTFEAQSCPGDGQYSLTESVDGRCFNATWYGVVQDHTPADTQGNMMIVNGTNKAGPIYQHSLAGLCRGTAYEVSVWVLNLLRTHTCLNPLVPKLSILIETKEGVLLQSTDLGPIAQTESPAWRRLSIGFAAPAATDEVVIKVVNNQGDYGCGNDLVIDDFQVKQCDACGAEQVYVPDAFTPNNDGKNDDLTFLVPKVTAYSLTVYNRWGSVIFSSSDLTRKWDGTYEGNPCPVGPYSWQITYRSTNSGGANPGGAERSFVRTGQVLLLR
ncbi:hypothetical protein GCM10027190_41160 [Spirosoma areae]